MSVKEYFCIIFGLYLMCNKILKVRNYFFTTVTVKILLKPYFKKKEIHCSKYLSCVFELKQFNYY